MNELIKKWIEYTEITNKDNDITNSTLPLMKSLGVAPDGVTKVVLDKRNFQDFMDWLVKTKD